MRQNDPTRAPAGRLTRLGVVVDPTSARAATTAVLCDRAGINVIWFGRHPITGDPDAGAEVWSTAATNVLVELRRAGTNALVGVEVSTGDADHALANREAFQEIWLSGAGDGDVPLPTPDLLLDGRRLSVTARSRLEFDELCGFADDVVLPAWTFPDLESASDEVRARSVLLGREPGSLGVAALLPVSVGRTEAEASARADADEHFRRLGEVRTIGIFGTLEECQDRVIALAHAGITDLRCILPAAPDVHDVIAQLTAMTVGTVDVLIPGSLRSPAPPPPEGWGGRPDVPPRQRISDGSRRR